MHWVDTNPYSVLPVPLVDAKVTMWCSNTDTVVLSAYFFQEAISKAFVTCSVTESCYTAILQKYAIPELQKGNELNEIIWM